MALRPSHPVFVLCMPTVLCADRVGQMTKTYNDIDAVTRLLEEVTWSIFVFSMCVLKLHCMIFTV